MVSYRKKRGCKGDYQVMKREKGRHQEHTLTQGGFFKRSSFMTATLFLYGYLIGVFIDKAFKESEKKNFYVQSQCPILDIIKIAIDSFSD